MLLLMVKQQIHAVTTYPIGFDSENLVEIDLTKLPAGTNPQTIKSEFLKYHQIQDATVCFGGPLTGRFSRSITFNDIATEIGYYQVDADFVKTLGIEIIKGNDFQKFTSNDSSYILFNETGARFFNLNKVDSLRSDLPVGSGKIVGIFKDFHSASLQEKVTPTFLQYKPFDKMGRFGTRILLRFEEISPENILLIHEIWRHLDPSREVEYSLIEDDYFSFYSHRDNQAKLLSLCAIAILVVTSFGIIGFTSFLAEKRMKEIAIRRVLGASSKVVYTIWLQNFSVPLIFSFIVAVPLAYYTIDEWSSIYIYKKPVPYTIIPVTLLIVIVAICLSSYYYLRKAVTNNPSAVLKYE
jgi:putative ABC transport system permease protein